MNRYHRICTVAVLVMTFAFGQTTFADKECQALMKQISDLVDRVERVLQRIGEAEGRVQRGEGTASSLETDKHTLQTDRATLKKTKVQIDNVLNKLCDCCAKKSVGAVPVSRDKECQALMKQISDLVDRVERVLQRIGEAEGRVQRGEGTASSLETDKHTLQTDRATLKKTKVQIDNVLNKLCDCCGKKSKPEPSPAPATGTIDRCLVGTWRSESVAGASRKRGGSGILLSIKADGQTTIDYSGMQAVEEVNPVTQEAVNKITWSGEATGHIATKDGSLTVSSVEKSKLTGQETSRYGTRPASASGLGTVFIGGGKAPSPYNLNYACSETALAIKQVVSGQMMMTFNFKREKKEP